MLAVAGMPSKLTVGAAIFGATPALVLAVWTAASPVNPWPAAAGPRSGRFRAVALRLAVAGRLATSRIDGEMSKPAAVATFGAELLAAAAVGAAAPWAVLASAETTKPVTSSSGTSHRARVRSLTVGPLPLAILARRRRCRMTPDTPTIRALRYVQEQTSQNIHTARECSVCL